MDRNNVYYRQVQFVVQLLPIISEEKCFALKGGTAINLFIWELPRLSVDIDLVYLPMKSRDEALSDIGGSLSRLAKKIRSTSPTTEVIESFKDKPDALRLIVNRNNAQVKIELSPVLRGTVFEPKAWSVCQKVEDEFGYAEITVVDEADLFAGKICAALDRQHPRDLFDVKRFLETREFSDKLRKTLIVYIISHSRPISELLQPTLKDIRQIYEGEFVDMVEERATLDELEQARGKLIGLVNSSLTKQEKEFLLSFKNKTPKWDLLGLQDVDGLPAVNWKLVNLERMPKDKHKKAYDKLANILEDS